uniref:G0/G1 switch 2 n=1 Tax=Ornithorhynchus anatinus TaxID=9258 RepID=A0A6I8NA08_ORNAN
METMQELIPFAKEMMTQKPNGKLAKLYLVGSVLAFFGVVIGLVETVCSPFTARVWPRKEEEEEEEAAAAGPGPAPAGIRLRAPGWRGGQPMGKSQPHGLGESNS